MNRSQNPIPWNKLLAVALLVGVIGYVLVRPTLERWWGVSLPSLTEGLDSPQPERSTAGPAEELTRPEVNPRNIPTATTPSEVAPSLPSNAAAESAPLSAPAARKPSSDNKTFGSKFELKKLDKGQLESPAGLIYALGPQGEHRVEHVMRHAKDEPTRPQHGVFNGSRNEILGLIDEAFQMVKQNSRQVSKQAEGNRTEYTVRFDRTIGYEGGRSGMRNNFPNVNRLRLVLEDGKYVVTAYPVK